MTEMKIKGCRYYSAERISSREKETRYYREKKLEDLKLGELVRRHLCSGALSECAVKRCCEMLDVCRYGQRYIELTGGDGHENG